jgi:predicted nucleic acid-binding protein
VIVVDTSVWIAFFRGRRPVVETLTALLDADDVALPVAVRIEILGGARRAEQARLARLLAALPLLRPTDETWVLIEEWVVAAAARGEHFGVGDLLIGAIAAENDCKVWSLDGDFSRLEHLGFLSLLATT